MSNNAEKSELTAGENSTATLESSLQCLKIINIYLPYDPVIQSSGNKTFPQKMSIATFS